MIRVKGKKNNNEIDSPTRMYSKYTHDGFVCFTFRCRRFSLRVEQKISHSQ